jgi:hypothetical protein
MGIELKIVSKKPTIDIVFSGFMLFAILELEKHTHFAATSQVLIYHKM